MPPASSEASLHSVLAIGMLATAVVVAWFLRFVTAPYGRHAKPGWGPTVPNRIGWLIMEMPAPVGFAAIYALGPFAGATGGLCLLALWLLHYVNRSLIYPFRIRDSGRRMPLAICFSGFAFNVLNAYLNARHITLFSGGYGTGWLTNTRFLMGAVLFLAGVVINVTADETLLALRKPGETGYAIPRGGLYRWVTSPNYLGELIVWTGWAIATWSLAGLAFAVWTAANLVPRALTHHAWYRERFPDYPSERRAVIPFLL